MTYTLRQMADALWKTGSQKDDPAEGERIYDRARMLRDRGLIKSSQSRSQGRTMTLSEADVAAAVVAITASLNGASWGQIQALNQDLRAIDNTQGRPEFERVISDIASGIPIFARLDIIAGEVPCTRARMGQAASVSLEAVPVAIGTTQMVFWPVTEIVKPILDYLASAGTN